MINFASCFTKGKALGWRTFPKCGVTLIYHLILGPYFENAPSLRLYPTLSELALRTPHMTQKKAQKWNPKKTQKLCI
jgi:hypothetical protein